MGLKQDKGKAIAQVVALSALTKDSVVHSKRMRDQVKGLRRLVWINLVLAVVCLVIAVVVVWKWF